MVSFFLTIYCSKQTLQSYFLPQTKFAKQCRAFYTQRITIIFNALALYLVNGVIWHL